MPILSANLKAQTDLQNTKTGWSAKVQELLGNSRRLRAFRAADTGAADPAATGVEFLNIGSNGSLTFAGGDIVGFGTLTDTTIRQAADLSTGACVLRLEGNGESITYSLGLLGSGADFTLPANPTGHSDVGFAFTAESGTRAPVKLDSGTGPFSPADMAKTPGFVDIRGWKTGSAVLAGTIVLSNRRPNMVMDDMEIATNMGDVRVYKPAQKVTLGGHEFGAICWGINKSINSEVQEPVYEVLTFFKPTEANWPGYPAASGYQYGVTDTFMEPFTATIRALDGTTILHVHQMRDGLCVNSPELNQDFSKVNVKPIRPLLHCAGALPWRSHRPKENSYAKKYHPGHVADVLDPKICRTHYGTNPPFPLWAGRIQLDGIHSWFSMPKWAVAANDTAMATVAPKDPWLYDIYNKYEPYDPIGYGRNAVSGWGYEAGACGGQDQLCGPGGIRGDRAWVSNTYAMYFTKRDYVRPYDNDPILDMVDAWSKNSYNLPNFFVTDVETGATIPLAEVFSNQWGHGRTYYGANPSYVAGGEIKTIPMFAIPNGGDVQYRDKNGRQIWNGASPDMLHNYWSFYWDALVFNSPMAIYATKHRLISSILCQLQDIPDTRNPSGWFLVRQHGWRWEHYIAAWKLRSNHEDGIPGAWTLQRFENELNSIHDYCYKPAMVDNDQGWYHSGLRDLGVTLGWGDHGVAMQSQSMTYYMTGMLHLMKQTGLWDVMYNRSDKCRKALEFTIRCMDLYAVDWILDTDGRVEDYDTLWVGSAAANPLDLAKSWADYSVRVNPREGVEDWITGSNGEFLKERYGSQHFRYQYVRFRIDYLSEIPCQRLNGLALAAAKYQGYYDTKKARVAGINGRDASLEVQWLYYMAHSAVLNPPAQS